jgi:hypothetical protein
MLLGLEKTLRSIELGEPLILLGIILAFVSVGEMSDSTTKVQKIAGV